MPAQVKENYYALFLSVLYGYTMEQAFDYLENGRPAQRRNRTLTKEDLQDMVKLKESMTYKAIGEIYNLSESSTYRRIEKYLKSEAKNNAINSYRKCTAADA